MSTGFKSKLWVFLNSAFGLFLLSSIFLGLLSFSYGQWVKNSERQRKAEQLNLEISLRLREMKSLSQGKDSQRYSNLVNIKQVIEGETSRFYVRKPLFNEFENKSMTTLLWQLYLLVPSRDQAAIKDAIRKCTAIDGLLREARYRAVEDLPYRPKTENEEEENRLAEAEDILNKDYGQFELYRRIRELAGTKQWRIRF